MPGLIRGVARTAVIAGTATAVSNNVSRRQAAKWNQQAQDQAPQQQAPQQAPPPEYAPPPQAAAGEDMGAQLQRLGDLKAQGLLTDEEFAAAKAKILGI